MDAELRLDDLTDVERAILRHAVADRGPGIFHNPLIGGSPDAVGRYLTEGGDLLPRFHWVAVWRCIVQLLTREPELLGSRALTRVEIDRQKAERVAVAEALLSDALGCFTAGQYDEVLTLVDRAEVAAPALHPSGRTYAELRAFVVEKRDAAVVAG